MRVLGIAGLGICVLLAGYAGTNCSSNGEAPYDAGSLPDAFFGEDGGSTSDAAPSPGEDGGDGSLSQAKDASSSEDAGDAATQAHDAGLGADAGDASEPDSSDASPSNASDASKDSGSDASQGADASDASQSDDASQGTDASDASQSEDASQGSDASQEEDASQQSEDASDGASSFDAASLCATFNSNTNPIQGVAAFDGSQLIEEDSTSGSVTGTGSPAYGDPVTITAWTLPVGIMQSVYVIYTTNGFATKVQVQLSSSGVSDAGPVGSAEAWSGQIPPQAHGTNVVWYVLGYDACTATGQYSRTSATTTRTRPRSGFPPGSRNCEARSSSSHPAGASLRGPLVLDVRAIHAPSRQARKSHAQVRRARRSDVPAAGPR